MCQIGVIGGVGGIQVFYAAMYEPVLPTRVCGGLASLLQTIAPRMFHDDV